MAQEIEKKFLVIGNDFKKEAFESSKIIQGYLSSVPERTVRIRIRDQSGFITIKGIGNQSGASRFEWEKEMPLNEAEALIKLCEPGVIDKTRYKVKTNGGTFEVDEFHGENNGLVVAEIELANENDAFDRPNWIGKELTGDKKYYNAMLMKSPFSKW
ncbi:CYTH domain-containing protein [Pedobacter changchengzhani]|uniref:CYTH domain-containing protein n=1 Tax=Pedobacter changchengzhani TaxID=2529274 RepID=A0A4R5ML25_9SPHI|nr:CYTH domain-containing protein [Pedobacter changchengzhani]TDG36390.1 CYTH domain-containing protein [Pedobacter changchengzhani]